MSVHPFFSRAQLAMASSWSELLDAATSEKEIVATVRDFVALLDAEDLKKLPPHCRPGKFHDAEDVTSFAFTLVRAECKPDDGGEDIALKLSAFFAHASIRLSQVMARRRRDDPGAQEQQQSA